MPSDAPFPARQEVLTRPEERALTAEAFHQLSDVPPAMEWFANIDNPRTRRAYENDLKDFMRFVGIEHPDEFRQVTRAHLIAWRQDLERRALAPSTIRRKLSALASLFDYLCECNAVALNPVKGVKRPPAESNEGKTWGYKNVPYWGNFPIVNPFTFDPFLPTYLSK